MPEQQPLPFELAQASHDERKNDLAIALLKVGGDLHLCQFCLWVFNVTKGGLEGELVKDYDQLAAAPWGLCCSYSKARTTAGRAKRLGLVSVSEHYDWKGSQEPNGYQIHWEGVLRIKTGTRFARGAPIEQGDALTEQGDALTEQRIRNTPSYTSIHQTSSSISTVPNGWEEAEEVLKNLEIGTYHALLNQAHERGEKPPEFLARIQRGLRTIRHPANRPRLTSPGGALAKWLRESVWPVSGLLDPDASPASSAGAPKRSSIDPETEALLLAKRMHAEGFSDGKIKAEQRTRGLPEVIPYRKESPP